VARYTARQIIPACDDSALAHPLGVSHILGTMREILPSIFMWGSTYADRPWDLNGYAIRLDECTVLVDPPVPGEDDWSSFEVMKPIAKIVLTNRDHVRNAELFRTRCGARLVAGADEVTISSASRLARSGCILTQRTTPFRVRWAASCS